MIASALALVSVILLLSSHSVLAYPLISSLANELLARYSLIVSSCLSSAVCNSGLIRDFPCSNPPVKVKFSFTISPFVDTPRLTSSNQSPFLCPATSFTSTGA